ncbi:hypothetical protein [Salmonella enterica]|uniref:Uncharacterized protein n=3 Tax=Salmonella enterica TaxID=28901 RepID=A0A3R0XWM7_SALET|nr:hypothetical protein [Salmonella enterica]EBW3154738.1 hypothetical protein [Salmonella enterica subsp. enterica serovar Java]EBW6041157.1 hypothetical protein [Salmonella enterica subsp. enterica serovar Oranienburg]ECJ4484610.1 hypothetical protein [Salmonella enterica subsp. diarizonae]ECT8867128.1 hypothetical protein [Salmonella enterica subsp. enterica serovar Pensacola]EHA8879262.1 hypothetical protein [Salmonella enterica subsp. enterica serovar Infantis]
MPGNSNEDNNTTYCEMNVSTEALEDLHCLLDTYSENLQEKLLLLAVVTHSLMSAQDIEYFESLLPCGHKIQFINNEALEQPSPPENYPPWLH